MARRRLRRGAVFYFCSEVDCEESQRRKATVARLRVARELEKVRPLAFGANERLFKRAMPDMDTFRRDLAAAGIEYIDNQGRFADFHAFRMTYSTLVALVEASERMRMQLNRHSDLRLTAHTYTDTRHK